MLRLLTILFAGVCACFGAALVMTAAALLPDWSALAPQALNGCFAGTLLTFAALFFSIAALLPALVVIVLGEGLAIRSVLFYTLAGVAVTCVLYLRASGWNTLAFTVDGFARREIEIVAASGIVAGFVYWALAGRKAGLWRSPIASGATTHDVVPGNPQGEQP